jgi:hypothetical protein
MNARAALAVRIRYLVAGLVLGLIWAWHADEPPWEHVLRLAIVVLILAPILHFAPQVLGIRRARARTRTRTRTRTRNVSWLRVLAAKVPLVGLALLADWGLRHWMTATASGLVTAAALAAAVAMVGPVLHWRFFVVTPRTGSAIGGRGHEQAAGPAAGPIAGSPEQTGRPTPPAPRSRRRIAGRLGIAALVLMTGFLLKHFVTHWILRHGLTDSGLAVVAALGAVAVALGIAAWVKRRRPVAGHARAHINEADMNNRPFIEEADHAATQHLADHVRPAPGRRDGVRRRPGGANPAH